MSCLTGVCQLPFRVLYEFVLSSQQLTDLGCIISVFRWGEDEAQETEGIAEDPLVSES